MASSRPEWHISHQIHARRCFTFIEWRRALHALTEAEVEGALDGVEQRVAWERGYAGVLALSHALHLHACIPFGSFMTVGDKGALNLSCLLGSLPNQLSTWRHGGIILRLGLCL